MTITFTAFGILNLILARARDLPDRLLHRVAWINPTWVPAFTGLCRFYRVPPPPISGTAIELPSTGALFAK
jgi:hypothetical protein